MCPSSPALRRTHSAQWAQPAVGDLIGGDGGRQELVVLLCHLTGDVELMVLRRAAGANGTWSEVRPQEAGLATGQGGNGGLVPLPATTVSSMCSGGLKPPRGGKPWLAPFFPSPRPSTFPSPVPILLLDVDSDGDLDLIFSIRRMSTIIENVGNATSPMWSSNASSSTNLTARLGLDSLVNHTSSGSCPRGEGGASSSSVSSGSAGVTTFAVGDVDGDGDDDVMALEATGGDDTSSLRISRGFYLENTGATGGMTLAPVARSSLANPFSAVVSAVLSTKSRRVPSVPLLVDLNGDGAMDVLLSNVPAEDGAWVSQRYVTKEHQWRVVRSGACDLGTLGSVGVFSAVAVPAAQVTMRTAMSASDVIVFMNSEQAGGNLFAVEVPVAANGSKGEWFKGATLDRTTFATVNTDIASIVCEQCKVDDDTGAVTNRTGTDIFGQRAQVAFADLTGNRMLDLLVILYGCCTFCCSLLLTFLAGTHPTCLLSGYNLVL